MTDPLGQSQVLPYLRELTKSGYEFHLLSFEKSDKFQKYKEHIQTICDASGIKWHPQNYSSEGGLKKTLHQISQMKRMARNLHREHQFEIVHCRSYIAALAGLQLKEKGAKFVFDMRGFWADERVDGGLWDLSKPLFRIIYNYFKRKEREYLRKADHIISLTHNGKKEIESWNIPGLNAQNKIEVIPCCVDLELFNPDSLSNKQQDLHKELDLKESTFILGYVGSIGTWYMLPEMLDYFKFLKRFKPEAKFLFITGENRETILPKVLERNIIENDILTVSALHKDVPGYISLFDASVFFIKPAYSKKASSPTKQGEIMAMGVPLICNSGVGDTSEIVARYNAGLVIDSFEFQDINLIPSREKFNSTEIKAGAKEYFSLEQGVQRYLKVYESLA